MFEAEDLVRQAIERHGDQLAVACSFGKDSMTVLSMALKYNPDIKVVFENTHVQFQETYDFRDRIIDEWNLNIFESHPKKTFWECADEYGLPECRKAGGKGSNSPKCCKYLKEDPGMELMKKIKVNAVITGLQKCESMNRSTLANRYDSGKAPYMEKEFDGEVVEFCGQRWWVKQFDLWKYHPIQYWSIQDVWDNICKKKMPINPVYTKWGGIYPRSGCLVCTAYKSWKERLSISHPGLFKHLMKIGGQAVLA